MKRASLLRSAPEIDALYDCLERVGAALDSLHIAYTLVAGSLLGALRSESILFCDDDVDIAVFEHDYKRVLAELPAALGHDATYVKRPWVAADRIRPRSCTQVWIDVFVLRRFDSPDDVRALVARKANGGAQPSSYVDAIMSSVETSRVIGSASRWPIWHYDNAKAISLWPREYFTSAELFPLRRAVFGPLSCPVPAHAVPQLRRAFGDDCFHVWLLAQQHAAYSADVAARIAALGSAANGAPVPMMEEDYAPVSHSARPAPSTRPHSRGALWETLRVADLWDGTLDEGAVVMPSLPREPPPSWFGAAVARATGFSPSPFVFDDALRAVMEPHVSKARAARESAARPSPLDYSPLQVEEVSVYSPQDFPLRAALAGALGLDRDFDLSRVHEVVSDVSGKHALTSRLRGREARSDFHSVYDAFVGAVVLPLFSRVAGDGVRVARVQGYPVTRLILPGEFSLGVHADCYYGFHKTINVVVPLTHDDGGAASLHVESAPGAEDWHPLVASYGEGALGRFMGSQCLHWTSENTTARTRASLDFRVVWGDAAWDDGAVAPRFIEPAGHFVVWRLNDVAQWTREGPLPDPDSRTGYPFGGISPQSVRVMTKERGE